MWFWMYIGQSCSLVSLWYWHKNLRPGLWLTCTCFKSKSNSKSKRKTKILSSKLSLNKSNMIQGSHSKSKVKWFSFSKSKSKSLLNPGSKISLARSLRGTEAHCRPIKQGRDKPWRRGDRLVRGNVARCKEQEHCFLNSMQPSANYFGLLFLCWYLSVRVSVSVTPYKNSTKSVQDRLDWCLNTRK